MKMILALMIILSVSVSTGCTKKETNDGAVTSSKDGGDVGTGSTGSLGSENSGGGSLPDAGNNSSNSQQ